MDLLLNLLQIAIAFLVSDKIYSKFHCTDDSWNARILWVPLALIVNGFFFNLIGLPLIGSIIGIPLFFYTLNKAVDIPPLPDAVYFYIYYSASYYGVGYIL